MLFCRDNNNIGKEVIFSFISNTYHLKCNRKVHGVGWHGIYSQNGSLVVWWSEVKNNGQRGIYQTGTNRSLKVYNTRIRHNVWDGILADSSNVAIKNSLISGNGSDGHYYGIHLLNPASGAVVHNNTIAHNDNEGIVFVGDNMPDVRNCILWGNDANQLSGLDEDSVYYCCIQDCNEINAGSNINDDPEFSYSQQAYGLHHLAIDSPCIDAGDNTYVDPNGTGEWDIDGDERIVNDYVDIGADEFACEELTHLLDWTFDGIIDVEELLIFTDAWLSHDPNDPLADPEHPNYVSDPNSPDYIYPGSLDNYDPRCDFDTDMDVDMPDWGYFAYYWRWRACWRTSSYGVWAMGESAMMETAALAQTETLSIAQPVVAAQSTQVSKASIEEEYAHAKEIVEWLEDLWKNDAEARKVIDKKDWKRFMNQIYDWIANLEEEL